MAGLVGSIVIALTLMARPRRGSLRPALMRAQDCPPSVVLNKPVVAPFGEVPTYIIEGLVESNAIEVTETVSPKLTEVQLWPPFVLLKTPPTSLPTYTVELSGSMATTKVKSSVIPVFTEPQFCPPSTVLKTPLA